MKTWWYFGNGLGFDGEKKGSLYAIPFHGLNLGLETGKKNHSLSEIQNPQFLCVCDNNQFLEFSK